MATYRWRRTVSDPGRRGRQRPLSQSTLTYQTLPAQHRVRNVYISLPVESGADAGGV